MPYVSDAQRKAVWASRNERKGKKSPAKQRSPFKMNSPFKNLNRWFKEEWKTPSGEEDYSKGENTFRPTKKVSSKTPKTWSEVTPESKRKAQKEKNTKGRVTKY